ncbi:MAG: hypothetical protein JSW51_13780 [Gemmatimonadota bacterium]|nr:MAG: hypothetical protein JSW51_13780 [Gemmatimonadota bacterium]
MTAGAVAMILAQTTLWQVSPSAVTVGDTVEMVLRLQIPAGVSAHADPLEASALVEPLSVPTVTHSGSSVVIQYKVAFFEAGYLGLAMPEIQLIDESGVVERVSGDTAWVRVISVLPEDTTLTPQPSLGPIARERKRVEFLVLPAAVVLVAAVVWALLRRRVRQRPTWHVGVRKRVEPPVVQWMNAGEPRTVVSAVTDRLRDSIAVALPDAGRQLSTEQCLAVIEEQRPEWAVSEIARVLHSLDRARFAPAVPTDIVELAERADEIAISLRRAALEEAER